MSFKRKRMIGRIRRAAALFLALALILAGPGAVFASDAEQGEDVPEPVLSEESTKNEDAAEEALLETASAAEGSCGTEGHEADVKWRISADGTKLSIYGTGPMRDYTEGTVPWKDSLSAITELYIEFGVLRLGNCAMQGAAALRSVTVAGDFYGGSVGDDGRPVDGSLRTIGDNAFAGCSSLSEVKLPDSLVGIGAGAFRGSGITSVVIPRYISAIKENTFSGCSALAAVQIPFRVTAVGQNAFDGCAALTDVRYTGAEEEWNAIAVSETGNAALTAASLHSAGEGPAEVMQAFSNADLFEVIFDAGGLQSVISSADSMHWFSLRPQIVFCAPGDYELSSTVTVPGGIVLAASKDAVFRYTGAGGEGTRFIDLNGCLYGGTYDGGWRLPADGGAGDAASYVQNVVYASAYVDRYECSGFMQNVTVTGSGGNGVFVAADLMASDCVMTKNAGSGIAVKSSDAENVDITGCRIDGNAGSQVRVSGSGAFLGLGDGNVILNGGKEGLLAESGGTIKFAGRGNQVSSNAASGISISGNGCVNIAGTANMVTYNGKCGIYSNGGRFFITGAENRIENNGTDGITAKGGTTVKISGSKTLIAKNGKSGLYAAGGSSVRIPGNNVKIQSNGTFGINAYGASVTVSGTGCLLSANKAEGICAKSKGKVTVSGASAQITGNKKNGIYLAGSSTVSVTGKSAKLNSNTGSGVSANASSFTMNGAGSQIRSNGKYGVYAADRAKITLRNTSVSGNKSGNYYQKGGAQISRA